MGPNVKPLTHWIIYKGYRVRFTSRAAHAVTGILTTPDGAVEFHYDPIEMIVKLPDEWVKINEYGWEETQ